LTNWPKHCPAVSPRKTGNQNRLTRLIEILPDVTLFQRALKRMRWIIS
jgi:hypothetical protein